MNYWIEGLYNNMNFCNCDYCRTKGRTTQIKDEFIQGVQGLDDYVKQIKQMEQIRVKQDTPLGDPIGDRIKELTKLVTLTEGEKIELEYLLKVKYAGLK